jgi:hypothetical protein
MIMAIEVKFAMPIGHDPSGSYSDFQGKVNLGPKSFRQPVTFDGKAATFVHGLDFVLDDWGPVPNLFALVDGRLFFKAADAAGPDRLVLNFHEEKVRPHLARVFHRRTIEAPPIRALYEGVDVAMTRQRLTDLLTAPANSSHPALKERANLKRPNGKVKKQSVKDYIADNGIDAFLALFVAGDVPILVRPGDPIGVAAAAGSGKRGVLLSMLDVGLQFLNPWFFLKQFVDATATGPAVVTKSLTPLTPDQPLIQKLNALGASPEPRVAVSGQIPFSIGPLASFHKFPLEGASRSVRQRGLVAQSKPNKLFAQFEAQAGSAPVAIPSPASNVTTLRNLWARSGPAINAICTVLSVPCEALLAIAGTESAGGGLAYRCEPLHDHERKLIKASPTAAPLLVKYDKTIGVKSTALTVSRNPAPAAIHNPSIIDATDGRPTVTMHIQLGARRTMTKWKWTSQPLDARRHFLYVDQGDGFVARIRAIKLVPDNTNPPTKVSRTLVDMTVDDQQFLCNRGGVTPIKSKKGAAAPGQRCDTRKVGQAVVKNKRWFFHPDDPCQEKAPVENTISPDVQHTITRAGVLRALYVNGISTEDVKVTVWINGAASAKLTLTMAGGAGKAALTSGSEEVTITSGTRISYEVVTGNADVTGLRIRLHLSAVDDAEVYLLDGTGNVGVAGARGNVSNTFPPTGVNENDNVSGPNGNTDHPLTWGELAQVLQADKGVLISPGIAQTLIAVAEENLIAAEQAIPDLINRINALIPAVPSLNVTPRPTKAAFPNDYLARYLIDPAHPQKLGWLMIEVNALLAGASHIRNRYTGRVGATHAFDLPAMCASYNVGSVQGAGKSSLWGVTIDPEYVKRAAGFYNAAITFFEDSVNPPNPTPAVRFRH